jgi:hypothetical protein
MFQDPKIVLVIGLAVGLWIPLANVEWFASHEGGSYVVRTVEWASELRRGELYPRWCPNFYGGYGSPFFVFYAPAVYAAAGLLAATVLDPFWALKMVALGASIIAGLGTYALVFGETRRREMAFLGAVAYLAAPYRIADLFVRGDLAEFTSIALLPGALALYRAVAFGSSLPGACRVAAAAAAVHAVLIVTHTVLGLWSTALIGLVVAATAVQLLRRGAPRRAALLAAAMAGAVGLAAIYLVPALVYKGITRTSEMVVGASDPRYNWIKPSALFDRGMYQIGPLLICAAVAVAWGLWRSPRAGRGALGWLALALALVALTLPQASWFWAPGRVPLARFVQFPWRLLGPAALAASVALALGMAAAWEQVSERVRTAGAFVIGAAVVLTLGWPHVTLTGWEAAAVPSDPDVIRQGMHSATGIDEYLPRSVLAPPAAPRRDLVAATEGAVVGMVISDGAHHALAVTAERGSAFIRLALHGFPGWKVKTLSGPADAVLDADERGLLRLRLPAPGPYQLQLLFGSSAAFRSGQALSGLTLLALCLLMAPPPRSWPGRRRLAALLSRRSG